MKQLLIAVLLTVMSVTPFAALAQGITEQEAQKVAKRYAGGRILDSKLGTFDRKPVYVVRMLVSKRKIRVFRVDANTGELLD